MQNTSLTYTALFLAGVLVAGAVFFFTPLRYAVLAAPTTNDVEPTAFYEEFEAADSKRILIDVRSPEAFAEVHVPGSINMPLHTLFSEWENLPKRGTTITLICEGGRAAGVGYGFLEHYGFLNLERIEGGIKAWEEAGLPVERE